MFTLAPTILHTCGELGKGEFLRIFRACSNRVEAFSHARFLLDPFYLRGHARRILEATYDEVVRLPPNHFFTRPEHGINRHVFTTPYHHSLAIFLRHLRRIWRQTNQSGSPPMVAWQRRRNLADMLPIRATPSGVLALVSMLPGNHLPKPNNNKKIQSFFPRDVDAASGALYIRPTAAEVFMQRM